MSSSSPRLIQIYGFHHCGTSILRKLVGNHPDIVDVLPEKRVAEARRRIEVAKSERKVGVVAKAVTRGRIDLKVFEGANCALLTIRNPEDVIPSLLLRNPSLDAHEIFDSWLRYASDYLAFRSSRVKKIRYEDLFDDDWTTLRSIFEFLELPWNEAAVVDNVDRKVPIHYPVVPDEMPGRRNHEAFRSWQINQKFAYMGNQNRHLLPSGVLDRLRSNEIVKELEYGDG